MRSDDVSSSESSKYFREYAPDIDFEELRAAAAPKDYDLDEELEEVNDKAEEYLRKLCKENGFNPFQKEMKGINLYLGDEGMIYSPYFEDLNWAGKFYHFLFGSEKNSETVDKSGINYWSPEQD